MTLTTFLRITFSAAVVVACPAVADAQAKPLFTFHSNPWVNLHHFIRAAARGVPARAEFSPEEQALWTAGVEFYKPWAARELTLDQPLIDINTGLMGSDGRSNLEGLPIDAGVRATLERVMPVYQKHFWPAHDRSNRAWIAAAEPIVARHGSASSQSLARVYGMTWPSEPLRVDVTVQAGPGSAYSTSPPTHIVVSSLDPSNAGYGALEVLLHESSHMWGVLRPTIFNAAGEQGVMVPPQLWHAVLFFTAGELTLRELKAHGITDYVDMATNLNVYTPMCGAGCKEKIAQHWMPHIDGTRSIPDALGGLVATFK